MKIKVILFEDDKDLRKIFCELINGDSNFDCVGAFPDCINIIEKIEKTKPDVVLMDIEMPYISGIEAIKMVKERFPNIKILMQTIFEDEEKIFQSIYSGASGYILKDTASDHILDSIIEAYNGGAPMSPLVATKVLKMVQPPAIKIKKDTFNLTEREKQVLTCLVNGMSYKLTADCCLISIGTVKTHIQSIYDKLHVHSKSQAVAKAIKGKIV